MSVERPEGTRQFWVVVPSKMTITDPIPLLLGWHGWTMSCTNIGFCADQWCDLGSHAERKGFVFVSVCGDGTSFNAGQCCSPANVMNNNDIQLARDIVNLITSQLCIDTAKVWTAGFSNGAMMSEVIGCMAPDVFSAVASVAGVMELGGSSGQERCRDAYSKASKQQTSVLMVHGNADLVVPWLGNALIGYPSQISNLAMWSGMNQCQGSAKQTYSNGDYTNQVYSVCHGGAQVELLKNFGGGHDWPQHSDFDTTLYILGFFARVSGWTPWRE